AGKITADRLVEADAQLELWEAPDEAAERRALAIQRAVDEINSVNGGQLSVVGVSVVRGTSRWQRPASGFADNRPPTHRPTDRGSPWRHHPPERPGAAQPLEVPPGEESDLGNRLLRGALVA